MRKVTLVSMLATLMMLFSINAFAASAFNSGSQGKLGQIYLNPYGLAPLTAIIHDGGNRIKDATVTVRGKGSKGIDISYKVQQKSIYTHSGIPVFGLYPDYNNQVSVSYTLNGKEKVTETYTIYAGPVNLPATGDGQCGMLPKVVPVTVDKDFKNRLYLINHIVRLPGDQQFKWKVDGGAGEWDWTSFNWITDTNGDCRWYMDITKIHDNKDIRKTGATMGFHQTKDGHLIWTMAQSYMKYDLMGRKIWQRELPLKFSDASHEIIEIPTGYMIRAAAAHYLRDDGKVVHTVRDHIVEVNESGDVVDYWDLNTILDPYRDNLLLALDQGAVCLNVDESQSGSTVSKAELEDPNAPFGDVTGVGPGRNWAHVNSISYDPKDDSIVLSARHQGTVKIGRDKQVKWILASPEGWTGELAKKVLKPVDSKGKAIKCENSTCEGDFDWSWTQHTSWLAHEKGTLMVFDNGDGRGMDQPALPTDKYSRAVEYKINEKKMTVQQIWEFGKERGYDWYSAITSVTEYLPDRDSVLVYSGSVNVYGSDGKGLNNYLHEFRYGQTKSAVELNVQGHINIGTGYRANLIRPELAF